MGRRLADQEDLAIKGAGGKPVAEVLDAHPWLKVCERTAQEQGFFHWQLDFATVFGRGGFDLQVGNPPWVRPTLDMDALLSEGDPWWKLADMPSEHDRAQQMANTLSIPGGGRDNPGRNRGCHIAEWLCRKHDQLPDPRRSPA